jgi:protein-tyrosine phosphatase
MVTDPLPQITRRVVLDSCQNFRDVGGYRTADGRNVRWRVLYRSDTLHRLTPADIETLRGLGIGVVIDLRSANEIERNGRISEAVPATYHHLPMIDEVVDRGQSWEFDAEPPPPGTSYIEMLKGAGPAIGRATEALVDAAGAPAVIHCTAGKDRTGILAGVLLSALGVGDDDVVADYELTNECRSERDAFLEVHDPEYLTMLRSLPRWVRIADGASMQATLDHVVDRFGSARAYLGSLGISEAQLAALEAALLEG